VAQEPLAVISPVVLLYAPKYLLVGSDANANKRIDPFGIELFMYGLLNGELLL
jgi:hypothetical protein